MQLLGTISNEISLVLIGVSLIGIVGFFKYLFKMDVKSTEFKVLVFFGIAIVAEAIVELIYVGYFNSDTLIMISITPISFLAISLCLWYIIKIIRNQESSLKGQSNRLKKIMQNSENVAVSVSNMATELSASANEVNASTEQISHTTIGIAERAKDQSNALIDINNMTQEIKNIAKFIVSISEQTNLLALNASIEAGRAGKHGLGFAVVADKVQKLAEESKLSVGKTTQLIETIVNNLQGVASASEEVSVGMEEISSGTEEQVASMEEISATATQLESLAEELKLQLIQK